MFLYVVKVCKMPGTHSFKMQYLISSEISKGETVLFLVVLRFRL